jgi:hypothetical protein
MQRHAVLTMRARLVFVGDADEIMAPEQDPENPDVVYHLPRFFELDPDIETLVGRNSSCNLILNHPKQTLMVSNQHLHIQFNKGQWIITDGTGGKPSTNGTLLNGNRVETEVLKDGDTLVLGGARCDKKLIAPNTAPPPTSIRSLYKFRVDIFHPQPALANSLLQNEIKQQALEITKLEGKNAKLARQVKLHKQLAMMRAQAEKRAEAKQEEQRKQHQRRKVVMRKATQKLKSLEAQRVKLEKEIHQLVEKAQELHNGERDSPDPAPGLPAFGSPAGRQSVDDDQQVQQGYPPEWLYSPARSDDDGFR